jgi:hypothetical protein
MGMKAYAQIAAAVLMMLGFAAPYGISNPSVPRSEQDEATLRGEAPHVALTASPRVVAPGEEITITGRLRGYRLGSSDFCLLPKWFVYGSMKSDGALLEIPIDDDPVQCRDHEFKHGFTFANAGIYGLRLELRTQGSKVRVADKAFIYVEVSESKGVTR